MVVKLTMVSDVKQLTRDMKRMNRLFDAQSLKLKNVSKSARGAKTQLKGMSTAGKFARQAFSFVSVTAGITAGTLALKAFLAEAERGKQFTLEGAGADKLLSSVKTSVKDLLDLQVLTTSIQLREGLTRDEAAKLVFTARSSAGLRDKDAILGSRLGVQSTDPTAILGGAGTLLAAFGKQVGSAQLAINKLVVAGKLGGGVKAEDIAKSAAQSAQQFFEAGFSDIAQLAVLSATSEGAGGADLASTAIRAFAVKTRDQGLKGNFLEVLDQVNRLKAKDPEKFRKDFEGNLRFVTGLGLINKNIETIKSTGAAISAQRQLTAQGRGAATVGFQESLQNPALTTLRTIGKTVASKETRERAFAPRSADIGLAQDRAVSAIKGEGIFPAAHRLTSKVFFDFLEAMGAGVEAFERAERQRLLRNAGISPTLDPSDLSKEHIEILKSIDRQLRIRTANDRSGGGTPRRIPRQSGIGD